MAWYRCGGESPTGNAIEAEVLAGKTFSNDDGTDKVGTMANNGAVTQSLNTGRTSYTIPEGYHSGSGSVSITTQEKTATPTTSSQAITPDSGKVLSKVTVNAIQTQAKTVTAGTAAASVTPDSGKYLSKVTYNPTPTQEKTITSSRSAQTVTPDGGKHLSKVTVNKYPDANGTYTYPANSTGGTYDMGTTNNLRYVNATNVYNKGKADGGIVESCVLCSRWNQGRDGDFSSKTTILTSNNTLITSEAENSWVNGNLLATIFDLNDYRLKVKALKACTVRYAANCPNPSYKIPYTTKTVSAGTIIASIFINDNYKGMTSICVTAHT